MDDEEDGFVNPVQVEDATTTDDSGYGTGETQADSDNQPGDEDRSHPPDPGYQQQGPPDPEEDEHERDNGLGINVNNIVNPQLDVAGPRNVQLRLRGRNEDENMSLSSSEGLGNPLDSSGIPRRMQTFQQPIQMIPLSAWEFYDYGGVTTYPSSSHTTNSMKSEWESEVQSDEESSHEAYLQPESGQVPYEDDLICWLQNRGEYENNLGELKSIWCAKSMYEFSQRDSIIWNTIQSSSDTCIHCCLWFVLLKSQCPG